MTNRADGTNKPKVFVWDFHGTLEEGVEIGFFEILKKLAKKFKADRKITLFEVREKYGITVAEYLRFFFPKANILQIKKMMEEVAEIQNQNHLKEYVRPAPGAIEVLSKIKKAGYENIVVSNSHPKHIEFLIDIVGMKNLISRVFAVDRHYSHRKQNPTKEKVKIFKMIIKQKNLKARQLITIGDKATDVNAGILAGGTTYQYLHKGFPIDGTEADYKIHDLREILGEI